MDVVKNGMFCFELNKSKCEANYDDILCKCSRHCFLFVFGLRVFLSIAEVIASGVPNVSMRAKARDRKEVGRGEDSCVKMDGDEKLSELCCDDNVGARLTDLQSAGIKI